MGRQLRGRKVHWKRQIAVAPQPSSEAAANRLMALFPTDSQKHISWIPGRTASTKRTVTVGRRPGPTEYEKHITASSREGPGALGVKPWLITTAEQPATKFMALDLDDLDADRLRESSFLDTLEGRGLHAYLTHGSTGRGLHIYFFFQEAVPLEAAKLASEVIEEILHASITPGLRVEHFPSSGTSEGKAIYLPNRGAALDGYGANPLLDPLVEFQPVALLDTQTRLRYTPATCIAELAVDRRTPLLVKATTQRTKLIASDARQLFEAEVKRIAPFWRPGVRNYLTKGFTAYAVSGLEVDEKEIIRALDELCVAPVTSTIRDEGENSRLVKAARGTIARHRNGDPVAWRSYYQQAGVAPPPPLNSNPERDNQVQLLTEQLNSFEFSPRTALADKGMYSTLIRLASEVGRLEAKGVTVQVARRTLAMDANMGDKGSKASLTRLRKYGLVATRRSDIPDEAGTIVLLLPGPDSNQDPQSVPINNRRAVQDWDPKFEHVAFRRRALGPISGLIVQALYQCGSRDLTSSQLADALGRYPYRFRKQLDLLTHYKVIGAGPGDTYRLTEDWETRLDEVAQTRGVLRVRESQIKRHQAEREAHSKFLSSRGLTGRRSPTSDVSAPSSRDSTPLGTSEYT